MTTTDHADLHWPRPDQLPGLGATLRRAHRAGPRPLVLAGLMLRVGP